jgi:hypothetical protein
MTGLRFRKRRCRDSLGSSLSFIDCLVVILVVLVKYVLLKRMPGMDNGNDICHINRRSPSITFLISVSFIAV